jgi:negative regulator of flagellin synthesis FlgM
MDMDKVNAMTQAIQNGTFKVNPEAIADKLLANAQEMLQGRMH